MDSPSIVLSLADGLAVNPLDPKSLIATFGLIGVFAILFAETGLLIGFFLPGDSLLFLAGVAASPVADRLVGTRLSLPLLLIGAPLFAIIGAQTGYLIGAKLGRRLFDKPESRLFKREHVDNAERYFTKYGPAKAIFLARFIPIVRTFMNPLAGVVNVPAGRFLAYNAVGGVVWTVGVILAGWKLADVIPASVIDKYLLPVVGLIVIISALPIFIEVYKSRRASS